MKRFIIFLALLAGCTYEQEVQQKLGGGLCQEFEERRLLYLCVAPRGSFICRYEDADDISCWRIATSAPERM